MIRLLLFFIICLLGLVLAFPLFASEEDRARGWQTLRTFKNFLYQEATLHNPEGDVVPDEIDNALFDHWQRR